MLKRRPAATRLPFSATIAVVLILALPACTSAPKHTVKVSSLIPSTLAMRRPEGAPADPRVGPGGTDYTSSPLPNAQWDCESAQEWLQTLPLSKIRACFATLQTSGTNPDANPVEASYRLIRDHQPRLELQDPEEMPACLREALPLIPVPREIFFQSTQAEVGLQCYSMRLPIEEDRRMGFRLPLKRWALKVVFPLRELPADDAAISRLLTGWALTPLWVKEGEAVSAKWVPANLCRQCLSKKQFLEEPKAGLDEWSPVQHP